VVAIYVLATGVKGLQLAGAPVWIPDLFNGLALLLAVGMAKYQGRSSGRMAAMRGSLHRGRARRQDEPAASIATPPEEKVQA
jgi:ribose transport system permease protein